MMNCNPETVSTDYDTSSRLYFEPLTVEDVLNVVDKERPDGIIVQFGGQTPLSLASQLQTALKDNPVPCASGACIWPYCWRPDNLCCMLGTCHAECERLLQPCHRLKWGQPPPTLRPCLRPMCLTLCAFRASPMR